MRWTWPSVRLTSIVNDVALYQVVATRVVDVGLTWSPEVLVRDTEAEIRALADAGRVGSLWREPFESWVAGNLIGTPEQVAAKIQTYVDLGCRGFVPWCADYPDHTTLRQFADQVIPEFRTPAPA